MLYVFEIHTFKKDFGLYCNLKLHSLGLLQLKSEKQNKTKHIRDYRKEWKTEGYQKPKKEGCGCTALNLGLSFLAARKKKET